MALLARTLRRAIGDVLAIRRIERSVVGGLVLRCDVLRRRKHLGGRVARPHTDWNGKQIIVGRNGRLAVVIRGVTNLLPIGRDSIIVLPAKRKHWRVVIARS